MQPVKSLDRTALASSGLPVSKRFRALRRLNLKQAAASIALAGAIAIWAAAHPGQFDQVEAWLESQAELIANRAPFLVLGAQVESTRAETVSAVLSAADIQFPASVLGIDFEDVRNRVLALDGIENAEIYVTPQSELRILVDERLPETVWRNNGNLELLDANGFRISLASSRLERLDLPLIAGGGAEAAVGEALEIFRVAETIKDQVRGLVRIGDRRWNLELKGERRILLPERGAVEALEKLISWDRAEKILHRDFESFDLRIANRPTVRMREPKAGEI